MKKGFTLVELLGVITILALIMLIIAPVVSDVISDSRNKTYQQQVEVIEKVAKQWGVENIDALPEPILGGQKAITLNTLIESGKIQNSSIIDPRTREEMTGCIIVSYNPEYNQYEYNYNEECNLKICTLINDVGMAGISYGDEYICDPGDGKLRTFFVLELPDTTLNKSNDTHKTNDRIGTTLNGKEVSLIMSENIDNKTVSWCKSGDSNSCNADNARDYLKKQTIDKGWTVEVNLPTYAQISTISNSNNNLPEWLINNLDDDSSTDIATGYFTSTGCKDWSTSAWVTYHHGSMLCTLVDMDNTHARGIRPVITISKEDL